MIHLYKILHFSVRKKMAASQASSSRYGNLIKRKGEITRSAILDAAHEVFRETGYYGSSISEITRRCNVSLATFYNYFKNKEQVFLELNDLLLSRFMANADALTGEGDFRERLTRLVQLIYNHTRDNFAFHRILGESELIDRVTISYYETIARLLRDFLRKETPRAGLRPVNPSIFAYGLIGVCYFHSLKWGDPVEAPKEETIRTIVDLLLHGISGPSPWKKPPQWNILSLPEPLPMQPVADEPLTKGEKTRKMILLAAEKVFSLSGANRANISDITREAGIAQGTFYVHFESKRDLFEGLVKYINHLFRRELQRAVLHAKDRRDAERLGILACNEFVYKHRGIYRLVPECEMIDEEVALWYYRKTSQGYIQGLAQGMRRGEIREYPPTFLARSLMGYIHFIELKWIVWSSTGAPMAPALLKDTIELMLYGLHQEKKRKGG
jgi:AcrR family transcriptional regulator